MYPIRTLGVFIFSFGLLAAIFSQDPAKPTWQYSAEWLRPFWLGEVVEGESVLFIRDEKTGECERRCCFRFAKCSRSRILSAT